MPDGAPLLSPHWSGLSPLGTVFVVQGAMLGSATCIRREPSRTCHSAPHLGVRKKADRVAHEFRAVCHSVAVFEACLGPPSVIECAGGKSRADHMTGVPPNFWKRARFRPPNLLVLRRRPCSVHSWLQAGAPLAGSTAPGVGRSLHDQRFCVGLIDLPAVQSSLLACSRVVPRAAPRSAPLAKRVLPLGTYSTISE
jgi:hypothetical protein